MVAGIMLLWNRYLAKGDKLAAMELTRLNEKCDDLKTQISSFNSALATRQTVLMCDTLHAFDEAEKIARRKVIDDGVERLKLGIIGHTHEILNGKTIYGETL